MDDPALGEAEHVKALRGLTRLNRLSGSADILWPSIAQIAITYPRRIIRVLDLATGSGDVPIALWQRAQRDGFRLSMAGCDVSERAVAYACAQAEREGTEVRFFVHDILTQPIPVAYDVVICSLFLHHLDDAQAVDVLRLMARAATYLVVVNDLRRSAWGLTLATLATRACSSSPVVRTDGVRSARAAFTVEEISALADQAGLTGHRVRRRWPVRWLLTWTRP